MMLKVRYIKIRVISKSLIYLQQFVCATNMGNGPEDFIRLSKDIYYLKQG
jgi:hypothetical protein